MEDPRSYICEVLGYMKGHSFMVLGAYLPRFPLEKTYLAFQGVEYFEGPLTWTSADFRFGERNECLELLRKLTRYDKAPDELLVEKFKLFLIDLPTGSITVKILALTGGVVQENPLNLFPKIYDFGTQS